MPTHFAILCEQLFSPLHCTFYADAQANVRFVWARIDSPRYISRLLTHDFVVFVNRKKSLENNLWLVDNLWRPRWRLTQCDRVNLQGKCNPSLEKWAKMQS